MKSANSIAQKLLAWWRKAGRVLPWREVMGRGELGRAAGVAPLLRETAMQSYFAGGIAGEIRRDPYRIVVSEMMLQQTQVDRVLPKFESWMARWPTVTDLAAATLPEVLIFWQGLGYNRRARYLWLLSQEIALARSGVWPRTETELLKLPGIGRYTARAIMSFAFGLPVGVVDTNVRRIAQRVWGIDDGAPPAGGAPKDLFAFMDSLLPSGQADPWNQALMDFGALICTAKNPKCAECPLQQECKGNLSAQQNGYPNFAAQLKTQLQAETKAKRTASSNPKIRFQDTDRYFRGRIIDELRQSDLKLTVLQQRLSEEYGLADLDRFTHIIAKLENDKLVQKRGETVSLHGGKSA